MRDARSQRRRRRLVGVALVVTLALVVLDLVAAPGPDLLRRGAATVLGPLERVLAPGDRPGVEELRRENERLAEDLRTARLSAEEGRAVAELLASPATSGATVVPARVVGVGAPGPQGVVRLTIDVGSRDGIEVDRTVVAAGGLVGRVDAVAPWTSDVLVVGGPDVVVGARVGAAGALATVGGPGSAATGRAPGELGMTLVEAGRLAVGDEVRTLGSVDGRPFVPGVLIGTVSAVEPQRGRLAPSGSVRPAVDIGRLSVVGVLLTEPRSAPRPAATGGGS
ncbi:rod shape-determining protein MreC [Knoellia remsis]|uniref:Cell shape-determining protein MreC n=1 Tax=Knoellia remsis TaxID=407159 RepID=A0A2T0V0G9_9MICO|nr:rod shape-determining protein MreC [Knoellia remsis]PRY63607.1 rod shape-determining protein MreC [Knoellia remsis]